LIKPDFSVIYLSFTGVAIDTPGFAKNDKNPSPIGFPAILGNSSPELMIGILDATIMLFLEFIFWRSRCWIPMFPECFYKKISFLICLKLEKNLFLKRGDNIVYLLFQPFFKSGWKLVFRVDSG
jgi:hypothetical protein